MSHLLFKVSEVLLMERPVMNRSPPYLAEASHFYTFIFILMFQRLVVAIITSTYLGLPPLAPKLAQHWLQHLSKYR